MAIENALGTVRETGDLPVPMAISNAPTKLMKDLGYNKGYLYAHDYENNFASQEYLPKISPGKNFMTPEKINGKKNSEDS